MVKEVSAPCTPPCDHQPVGLLDPAFGFGPFLAGWLAGWLLLWNARPLPRVDPDNAASSPSDSRPAIAIVVPARNEAEALTHLLPPLVAGARPDDEIVVVDDHSLDATARIAHEFGARVVVPPTLPEGWLGKPHACWHGANATAAPLLAFVDADVRPPPDLLDRIGVAHRDGEVTSVQPWHVPGSPAEQLNVLFNVVALMGVGSFSAFALQPRSRAAFGPILAVDRTTYDRVGGHADPTVRHRHTEDIALARSVGAARLFGGRPDIAFRMYPGGLRPLVQGWTRSLATGAGAGPWWATIGTAAWVWSLAAGWLVAWWLYVPCAAQLWVLARRAGRFSPMVVALYPLAVVIFVLVFARSLLVVALGRDVQWKGRTIPSR